MHRADTTDVTASGVVKTGGITSISSGVITNLTNATDINVGDWVTMDKGFDTQRYKILGRTATTATVDGAATSSETGVTVTVVANMYTIGDGVSINRTVYGPDQANALQEELANLIIGAGFSLTKNNNKQLLQSVVLKTGDTVPGALNVVNDLSANNLILNKKNQNTAADTVIDFSRKGGIYTFNTIAVNTSKDILYSPLITGDSWFIIRGTIRFSIGASNYFSSFVAPAKNVGISNRFFIVPERILIGTGAPSPSLDTMGGLYLCHDSNSSDETLIDGSAAQNDQPAIILGRDGSGNQHIKIRNTHSTSVLTNVVLYLEFIDIDGI